MIQAFAKTGLALVLALGMSFSFVPITHASHSHTPDRDQRDMTIQRHERVWTGELIGVSMRGAREGILQLRGGHTVHFNEHTRFERRFGGTASIGELQLGDHLRITGHINNRNQKIARVVRDLSIQHEKDQTFTGEIIAINEANNTMQILVEGTRDRDDKIEVAYRNNTPIFDDGDREDEDDLDLGDTVRVRGQARFNNSHIRMHDITSIHIIAD